MKLLIVLMFSFVGLIASAQAAEKSSTTAQAQQQPPDPSFLQRALIVLQTQRNQAMDAVAASEARAAGLIEELEKVKARAKGLEAKANPENKK